MSFDPEYNTQTDCIMFETQGRMVELDWLISDVVEFFDITIKGVINISLTERLNKIESKIEMGLDGNPRVLIEPCSVTLYCESMEDAENLNEFIENFRWVLEENP